MTQTKTTASERSINFLVSLVAERDVIPGADASECLLELTKWFTKPRSQAEVSRQIDKALKKPRRAKAPAVAKPYGDRTPTIDEPIPNGKFAIRSDLLTTARTDNEYVFFEVRNRPHRTRAIRRLTGAPGAFTRSPLAPRVRAEVLEFLADPDRAVEAGKAFSREYSVCYRCGAELTDDQSRADSLGPVCKKQMDAWISTGREPTL